MGWRNAWLTACSVLALAPAGCGGRAAHESAGTPATTPPASGDEYKLPRPSAVRLRNVSVVYDLERRLLDAVDDERPLADLARLNGGQRALYAVLVLDGEIQGDGFASLFYNGYCALLEDGARGADLLGAPDYAAILNDAIALVPAGSLPEDESRCEPLLEGIPEASLIRLDDRWYELYERDPLNEHVRRYVATHEDQFFR